MLIVPLYSLYDPACAEATPYTSACNTEKPSPAPREERRAHREHLLLHQREPRVVRRRVNNRTQNVVMFVFVMHTLYIYTYIVRSFGCLPARPRTRSSSRRFSSALSQSLAPATWVGRLHGNIRRAAIQFVSMQYIHNTFVLYTLH